VLINLYKSASDNFHEVIPVSDSKTIKEALPDIDFKNAIIAVNGDFTDENYILKENDICSIRVFPKLTALAITAAIIVGLVITNEIVRAVTGKSLLQWAGEWLRDWLFPDQGSNSNEQESLQNIPQLRGARNQSNRNKPIPLVLGRHFYTPMYIGTPYTEIGGVDGEDQYYTALYLLGWGDLKVSDVRLGPVSGISRNVSGTLNGMLPYNDDPAFGDPSFAASYPQLELRHTGEVGLYPQRVVEERLSIELMNVPRESGGYDTNEPIRFSAKNPQRVQVEITFNGGLISYDVEGNKQNASVDIRLEWRGNPQSNTWYEFGQFGGGQSPTSYNPSARTTTITRQKAKQMRFIAERNFSFSEANAAVNRTIEIRVVRTNPKDPSDIRTADTVFLSAIRTWCFDYDLTIANNNQMVIQRPMIEKYRDKTARLGFRIKATDILQGTIDSLNCMVQSYARTWNGSWSTSESPTNNPASVALKILQSPALGNNAYPDLMIDLDSFGEFYKWCTDREYTCNGVLVNEKRVDDLLTAILQTGRGMRVLNETKYAVLIDKERDNPVAVLNSQNVLQATNQKNFDDLPDGFSVRFINEIDGYQETEIFVMKDGTNKPKPESRIENIEMLFVTDYKQIVRNAWYMLACRYLRPEVWLRKVSVDGYLVGIGSLVEVQDDTILVGIGEGAVVTGLKNNGLYITEIETDGFFEVYEMNKLYGIKIMQFDGYNQGRVRTIQVPIPSPGIYNKFTVSIPLDDKPIPSKGDIVAFGEYGKITTQAICFGKKPAGDGTFDLTLIPYQEGIYTTDTGQIPEYQHNITSPQAIPPLNQIPPPPVSMPQLVDTITNMDLTGYPAVMHEVIPSVQMIIKSSDGVLEPDTISCSQVMIVGHNLPVPSNKLLQYKTSKSNVFLLYTGPVQIGEFDWIEFLLSDNGIELDSQRVPVLREGSDAVFLDIENQNYPIMCNYEDQQPTEGQLPFSVQCRLYRGIKLASDVIWEIDAPRGISIDQNGLIRVNPEYKYANDIVYYPAKDGIFDPMLGTFHAFSGNWITGQTELGMVTEMEVRAVYQGEVLTRIFRIRKVLNGKQGDKGDTGAQGDPAPKYLGKSVTKTTTSTVYIQFTDTVSGYVNAKTGDYFAYVGPSDSGSSIWKKNTCLQWNGTQWISLDAMSSANTDFYMRALRDITEGAEPGVFSYILAGKIMAMEATITTLMSTLLQVNNAIFGGPRFTLGPQGLVDNGSNLNGFKLGADGKLLASNGIFSGELQARYINITGSVSSGTQYILRSNNSLVALYSQNISWITATYLGVAKEIRTLAKGSCTIKLRFPLVGSASTSNVNVGRYAIYVNGSEVVSLRYYQIDTDMYHDISLPNDVNTISLYGVPESNQMVLFGFFNTVFELRCSQDPGFLAVLG
jgi:hypothetical protein